MTHVLCEPAVCTIQLRSGRKLIGAVTGWRTFRDARSKRPRGTLCGIDDVLLGVNDAMRSGTAGVVFVQVIGEQTAGVLPIADLQTIELTNASREVVEQAPAPFGVFSLVNVARAPADAEPFVYVATRPHTLLGLTVYSRIANGTPGLLVGGAIVELEPVSTDSIARSYRAPTRPRLAAGDAVHIAFAQDGRTTTAVVYVELVPRIETETEV